MELESVIGLEIHVQLKTKSKMFCSCDNTGELQQPNTTVCPICLGHPGTLPVVNADAIRMGILTALALNLKVALHSKFDRKNYFYPDLPKGYQISQYDEPLAQKGYLEIDTPLGKKKVHLERLHLEEDTGKLLHAENNTLVDFNRAGTPLMEIVTEPEVLQPEEAKAFLQDLKAILRALNVSDADMEKGHLRVDVNVSLRPKGEKKLYAKTELKNLNSFRSVERGLKYEINRLTELWNQGHPPEITETRGWDESKGASVTQRIKETVNDYRYFPEPDLPPINFTKTEIVKIKEQMPELPKDSVARLAKDYGLSKIDAGVLTADSNLLNFFEQTVKGLEAGSEDIENQPAAKLTANWLINKLSQLLNESDLEIQDVKFSADQFVQFLLLVATRRVNSTNGVLLLKRMLKTGNDAEQILAEEDLEQGTEDLSSVIQKVINLYPEQVEQFKGGKDPVIKFLVGAVMKQSKGKADPVEAETELRKVILG